MSTKIWNITKYAVAQYAQAVENLEPIYLDPQSAQAAGFPAPIAPTSFCAQYQMYMDPAVKVPNGGVHVKQKMSFFKPIKAGDKITADTQVSEGTDAKGRLLIQYTTTFTNQDGDIVCSGTMVNMIPGGKDGGAGK